MEQTLMFGHPEHKLPRGTKETMPAAVAPAPKKRLTAWKPKLSERDVTKQIRDRMELWGWIAIRRTPGRLVPFQLVRDCLDRVLQDLSKSPGIAVATVHNVLDTLNRSISVGGERGDPDWLFVHPEFPPCWVEMKAPGQKPTPEQIFRHKQLEEGFGFIVLVASSYEQFVADYAMRVGPFVNSNAPRLRRKITMSGMIG